MKETYSALIISLGVTLISSCQKELSNDALSSQLDVYVAGFEGEWGEPSTVAKYWKNGNAVNLSDGSKFTYANAIAVSGNNVFVTGTEYTDSSSVAIYWKNGTPIRLANNIGNTQTFAIATSGNDVYVAGIIVLPSGIRTPVYWKNGELIKLAGQNITPSSIAISAGNVYVTGVADTLLGDLYSSYHMHYGKLWKNGSLVDLPTSFPAYFMGSWANSIAVSGNDIYIAGNENFGVTVAKYWKNEVSSNPMGVSGQSWASSIAVSGSDIYIAGWDYDGANFTIASYWKNDSLVNIGTQASYANSIAVTNKDVYIAGEEFNGTNLMATYWKNGTATHLTDGSKPAEARSICIALR